MWVDPPTHLFAHPSRERVYRLFTAVEHARINQISERIISGMTQAKAHALLGQCVLVTLVKVLFQRIGLSVRKWAQEIDTGEEVTQHSPVYQIALASG